MSELLVLLEKWWPVLIIFIPAILSRLGIKVPVIVPSPTPVPVPVPVPSPLLPSLPTGVGQGQIIKWLIDAAPILIPALMNAFKIKMEDGKISIEAVVPPQEPQL